MSGRDRIPRIPTTTSLASAADPADWASKVFGEGISGYGWVLLMAACLWLDGIGFGGTVGQDDDNDEMTFMTNDERLGSNIPIYLNEVHNPHTYQSLYLSLFYQVYRVLVDGSVLPLLFVAFRPGPHRLYLM